MESFIPEDSLCGTIFLMGHVFIERLWRSVKHEGVYLWAHENMKEDNVSYFSHIWMGRERGAIRKQDNYEE
jgi:hypothetical protein